MTLINFPNLHMKMKNPNLTISILSVCLLMPLYCRGQSTKTGTASASGNCAVAHSGNNDTITIKNCGIGVEQGDKIVFLLNEVLSRGDLTSINKKLDELLSIVGPVKINIVKFLSAPAIAGRNPRSSIEFYTERADNEGQFEVLCDHACTPIDMCTLLGANSGLLANVSDDQNVAVFLFKRQFPALTGCYLSVESRDKFPVNILKISALDRTRLAKLVPTATQPKPRVTAGGVAIQ
jgi:hypothetical protein